MKKDYRQQMIKSFLVAGLMVLATGAVAYAAGGGGHESHDIDWKDFGYRVLNFAILAGFLWWLSAKKVKEFFAGRRTDIKAALDQALVAK